MYDVLANLELPPRLHVQSVARLTAKGALRGILYSLACLAAVWQKQTHREGMTVFLTYA